MTLSGYLVPVHIVSMFHTPLREYDLDLLNYPAPPCHGGRGYVNDLVGMALLVVDNDRS